MPFPLEPGQYFGVQEEGNDRVVSRGVWVVQIRRATARRPGSVYDEDTANMVRGWQEENGLPPTGEVTDEDWAVMFPEEGT